MLDYSNRDLEEMIEGLRRQVRKLTAHVNTVEQELCLVRGEYRDEIKRLKANPKIAIPDAVLEAIVAIVYWSRSDESDEHHPRVRHPVARPMGSRARTAAAG
jgi:hypothetical protein